MLTAIEVAHPEVCFIRFISITFHIISITVFLCHVYRPKDIFYNMPHGFTLLTTSGGLRSNVEYVREVLMGLSQSDRGSCLRTIKF